MEQRAVRLPLSTQGQRMPTIVQKHKVETAAPGERERTRGSTTMGISFHSAAMPALEVKAATPAPWGARRQAHRPEPLPMAGMEATPGHQGQERRTVLGTTVAMVEQRQQAPLTPTQVGVRKRGVPRRGGMAATG